MTQKPDDQYSKVEAQRRFMASLRAAVNTPPTPRKSMTPKRSRKQLSGKAKAR